MQCRVFGIIKKAEFEAAVCNSYVKENKKERTFNERIKGKSTSYGSCQMCSGSG